MTITLRDSGLFPGDKRLQRVVAWIKLCNTLKQRAIGAYTNQF